jgi:branched-chain amino acid transport system permease protein
VMGLTPMSVYVTMLVIGGLGTSTGPIIGTILVQIVATALVTHPGAEFTILGLFLLVVVIFVPDGLTGLISRYWHRIGAWVAEDEADDEVLADDETAAHDATGAAEPAGVQPEGSTDPHVA